MGQLKLIEDWIVALIDPGLNPTFSLSLESNVAALVVNQRRVIGKGLKYLIGLI